MKIALRSSFKPDFQILFFIVAFLLVTTFSQQAEASQQISSSLHNQSNMDLNSGPGKGEVVWVLITLVFSFTLNYLIRKGEKRPESLAKEQIAPIVSENKPVTQLGHLSGSKTRLAGKWIYTNSRTHFRRKHFLQNMETFSLLNGIHDKQKIAS
jgi:hypothetical protein